MRPQGVSPGARSHSKVAWTLVWVQELVLPFTQLLSGPGLSTGTRVRQSPGAGAKAEKAHQLVRKRLDPELG